jgi:hypothetical protein
MMFARSAPENRSSCGRSPQGQRRGRASRLRVDFRICSRPFTSGRSTTTGDRAPDAEARIKHVGTVRRGRIISPLVRRNRPSRRGAGSGSFALIVRIHGIESGLAMASSSSINTMHGAFSRACLNRSRRDSRRHRRTSRRNRNPKSGKTHSLRRRRHARAGSCRYGRSDEKNPARILPPISVYFFGNFRKSTT